MYLIPDKVHDYLSCFRRSITKLFKPKPYTPNSLKLQHDSIAEIKAHPDYMVVWSDKNLGPVVIEREKVMRYSIELLKNPDQYTQLSADEAATFEAKTKTCGGMAG